MSNILALRGNFDLASLNDLGTHLANVQRSMSSTSAEPFLRMGRDGKWIYGADGVEVEPGSQWAVHPLSVEHGYVCWNREDTGQKKLGDAMVPFTQPKPALASLPVHGSSPWAEQISFVLVCVSGEDTGTQVKYASSSIGGMNEVKNNLLNTMIGRIEKEKKQHGSIDPETSEIVPVVTLDNSFYIHSQYGKIYTPIFSIVRWGSLSNQEEKPAPRAANMAEEPTVAASPDAPRRRMRQRA